MVQRIITMTMLFTVLFFISCQSTANRTGAPRPSQAVSKEVFAAKLSELDECQGVDQQTIGDFHSRLDQCDDFVHSPVETEVSTPETPVESGFALGAGGGLPRLITACYKAVCSWFKKTPDVSRPPGKETVNPYATPKDYVETPGEPGVDNSYGTRASKDAIEELKKLQHEIYIKKYLDSPEPWKLPKELQDKKNKALRDPSDQKICSLPVNCDPDRDRHPFFCGGYPRYNASDVCSRKLAEILACAARVSEQVLSGTCTHRILPSGTIVWYGSELARYALDYASCASCLRYHRNPEADRLP
jgi:hypothetical protein